MSNYTMDQYTLQSYFKSVCNSFYIAYSQVKRLEKEKEELEKTTPHQELKVINALLKIPNEDECWRKYVTQNCSKDELQEKKEKLQLDLEKYNEKCKKLEWAIEFWSTRLWNEGARNIERILFKIKESKYSIIVTSKEEIISLMAFFREHSVKKYRIINTDERYLSSFPTGEKIYEEFYRAYCLEDDEEMEKVCSKYF